MSHKKDTQPKPGDIIQTEDGYRFSVLEDGSVTDGDMAWESVEQFRSTMADDPQGPIGWEIKYRDNVTDTKIAMVCSDCGSTAVVADAYAAWDADKQDWTIDNVFDKGAYCDTCEGETRITSVPLLSIKQDDLPRCDECKDECTDDEMIGVDGRLLCEPCADKNGAK